MATLEPPLEEPLSRAEREKLLGAMSPADWARANSLARWASAGLADMGADDVLAEVLAALISMRRVWQRGVPTLVTLQRAMLSVASNARKKDAEGPIDRFAIVASGFEEEAEGATLTVQAIEYRTPESVVEARSQLAWIERLVKGDADAMCVLRAWATGLSGVEAQRDSGLDAKKFDAARHRLQRKLKVVADVRNPK